MSIQFRVFGWTVTLDIARRYTALGLCCELHRSGKPLVVRV